MPQNKKPNIAEIVTKLVNDFTDISKKASQLTKDFEDDFSTSAYSFYRGFIVAPTALNATAVLDKVCWKNDKPTREYPMYAGYFAGIGVSLVETGYLFSQTFGKDQNLIPLIGLAVIQAGFFAYNKIDNARKTREF